MSLKRNINKIHIELINNFNEVSVIEKSNLELGNYFEFIINESDKVIKAIISKKDIENDSFIWRYYSDPTNEMSHLIERVSTVDKFTSVVKDIFEKNRFDSDYLKSLKC